MTGYFYFKIWILSFLIFNFSIICSLQGQESSPIEKSTEKIVFQGKVYLLHVVKKGQTIYSICKVYNITNQDIFVSNPGISLSNISEGQILRIPVTEQSGKPDQADEKKDNFILHKVQPKETTYSLHIKYNISIDDLYKYNVGLEKGIQIGQIIKIPTSPSNPFDNKPLISDKKKKYEIRKGDSLYEIAKKYHVSEADLINANESLRWGLKPGTIIIIPDISSNVQRTSASATDTSFLPKNELFFQHVNCDSISASRIPMTLKLALILPFYSSESFISDSTLMNENPDDSDMKSKATLFKGSGAVEFYEGVLLALDSLKKEGVNINLYVYDDEGDTNKTKQIIHELDTLKPDIILGPFNNDNTRLISKFSLRTQTLFVAPLSKDDSLIRQNPFLFLPIPSSEGEMKSSIEFLSQYKGQNIIFIHKADLIRKNDVDQFKMQLKKSLSIEENDSSVFKERFIDASMKNTIKTALRNDLKNIVVIISSQEPDVSNVLTLLYTYSRYYDINVFGLPSWQKFNNVRIDYFHDLQVTLYTPFFIDYNNEFVKSFVGSCRNVLGFEPYKTTSKGTGMNYTFYGYDLTFYFVKVFNKYGRNTVLCADNYKARNSLLLSNYNFIRNSQTGNWENRSLNFIRYNKDFSIEKLNTK